ncbi:MAG: hypothetical protein HYR60_02645 [Acidobacteria bacterium]|nr:hypothetical protein [Acidobacteriota bacterium]MBI3473827.1 hypothetical protein [Candidatus Solibacter usitatus]
MVIGTAFAASLGGALLLQRACLAAWFRVIQWRRRRLLARATLRVL